MMSTIKVNCRIHWKVVYTVDTFEQPSPGQIHCRQMQPGHLMVLIWQILPDLI